MGSADAALGVWVPFPAFQKLTGKGAFLYNLDANGQFICFRRKNLSVYFSSVQALAGSELRLPVRVVKHKRIYCWVEKTFNNKGALEEIINIRSGSPRSPPTLLIWKELFSCPQLHNSLRAFFAPALPAMTGRSSGLTLVCCTPGQRCGCPLHTFWSRFQTESNFPRIHQSRGPPFLWEHKIQTCSAVFNKGTMRESSVLRHCRTRCPSNTPCANCLPGAGGKGCSAISCVGDGHCRAFI